jgi:diaminohydroxyphosphoribosylaminopyrimidine deaminase/5-amino-6-(5-phosphoribosylamino)uracil reductase
MERALSLALMGWGRVAPNPLVGAVLLRDGEVIGEGYHAEFGRPHAEAAALAACGDARGATLVTNLEPCAHHGKTPPCADALIAAGVGRVVCAVEDPSPAARGGAARLRAAGVEVEVGVCKREAAALNAAFLYAETRPERPFVAVKLATSMDGFIADAGGCSQWISGERAREFVHWLRAGFDALGVGRRTAEVDDPELTVRVPLEPRVPPLRVIFTRRGEVRPGLRLIETATARPTVVVTESGARDRTRDALGPAGVTVVGGDGLAQQLRELRARGVRSLLVEGGAAVVGALLDSELVDRLYLIEAPRWLGDGVRAFGARSPITLDASVAWVVTERRSLGLDTLLVIDRELCSPGS